MRLPPVIGHRGAAGLAPENTLASFAAAAGLGAAMVEFDVRLSADGVPVVFHDDTLERTTDGTGAVAASDLAGLKRLDAGGWFAPRFAGETVPTLDEALARCLELGLMVNMEIKPDRGREAETAVAALRGAQKLWPPDRPPPLISSFEAACLEAAATQAPHWPRGLLVERLPKDWRQRAGRLGCVSLHAEHRGLDAEQVAELAASGLLVLAYTVNDQELQRQLWEWGVRSVFTDFPHLS